MSSVTAPPRVRRLARFGLTSPDAELLARFYMQAFDCSEVSRERRAGARFEQSLKVRGSAQCVTLKLGDTTLEILQFEHAGRPYPPALAPQDNLFQHFALVVSDMQAAFARLGTLRGWSAISSGAPQRLPESAGGVSAYKFRDPDGHPLEFLSFEAGRAPAAWPPSARQSLFLGIDHSAVSVAQVPRSLAFYESLGLTVGSRSLNRGEEQARLDGIHAPVVDVIGLAPPVATPHVELLCYHGATTRSVIHSHDVGATRLIFERAPMPGAPQADELIVDPDGHHLLVTAPCASSPSCS
jgi:catechol 2,3-dioxygenase-like lactoylglutathione lyase family enzyme